VKTIIRISLFLTVLIVFLPAQSTEILNVRIDQNEENKQPPILHVDVQNDASISQAVFIELPAGLKPVLKSAKQGGEELWLINSKEEIIQDNVIGWYTKKNGLVVHYNDFINNNGLLEIKLVPDSSRLQRFENIDVKIYPVSKSGQDLVVQKSVLAQTNVSVKKVEKEQ